MLAAAQQEGSTFNNPDLTASKFVACDSTLFRLRPLEVLHRSGDQQQIDARPPVLCRGSSSLRGGWGRWRCQPRCRRLWRLRAAGRSTCRPGCGLLHGPDRCCQLLLPRCVWPWPWGGACCAHAGTFWTTGTPASLESWAWLRPSIPRPPSRRCSAPRLPVPGPGEAAGVQRRRGRRRLAGPQVSDGQRERGLSHRPAAAAGPDGLQFR
jgi:hypothetical protein